MECPVKDKAASAEQIGRLEGSTGFYPMHGDTKVGTEYGSGAGPAGDFPQQFQGVPSSIVLLQTRRGPHT